MTTLNAKANRGLTTGQWVTLGAVAAVLAVIAVLAVQAIALQIWPDAALFKPLDSFARAALFTAVPAFAATAVFAWLAGRKSDPAGAFIRVAVVVLLLSFIPDYLLPVPHKTFLASTIAAFLHIVAAVVITGVLVTGYRRLAGRA